MLMEYAPVPPKLLILAAQEDEAKGIVVGLRRVGLEARGRHCPGPDKLADMVASSDPDILLCSPQPPLLDLAACLKQFRKLDIDLPLILLADAATDTEQFLDARRQGARDVTEKGSFAWLALVIGREFGDLQHRRLVKKLKRKVLDLEESCGKTAVDKPGTVLTGSDQLRTMDEDRQFAQRIKRALGGDYFQLFYQPIISLKGDGQERFNVFIRLRDDRHGVREAKEFLAAAVQSGRMVAIDHWVIEHAILALVEQQALGRQLNFFINLAEETLREEKLANWIAHLFAHQQVQAHWLTFQVLEEHARANAAIYNHLTRNMAEIGCRMAINRFGISPHPDKLLANLPADFIKLDAQLTAGIADDDRKERRITQLIELIRDQGKSSIATNVEDARTLSVLWTAGIDYVQGNFLQRPSPTLEPIQ
jgi:EAL domain-containing protein (putative c-di-GMP-specific phosphodiesterase class I)